MRSVTRSISAATLAPCVALAAAVLPAGAGVLLDYGADPGALNDAGVIRAGDNPNEQFGFDQYQLINVDAAAWRVDRITVTLRLWNAIATGEATLAVYTADGLEPDLLGRVSPEIAFTVASLGGEAIDLDMGGLELDRGIYFVGIHAATPTAELLWLAGEDEAYRTAGRSDGEFFSGSPRSLSLLIDGAVVPAPAGATLLLAGLACRRRR